MSKGHPLTKPAKQSPDEASEKGVEKAVVFVDVLLIEDNAGDIRLTQEAFRGLNNKFLRLHVATNGVEAMAFLRCEGAHRKAPRPDLILLDINLPKMSGYEILQQIKADQALTSIPTIILTKSELEEDYAKSYALHANCFLKKGGGWDVFEALVKSIEALWLTEIPGKHSVRSRDLTELRGVFRGD